jgi:hypothetical protein
MKSKVKKTVALCGAIVTLAIAAPALAQYYGKATTEDPDKPAGARTIIITAGTAPDGGIRTTSSGSTRLIRNGP